jgi:NAD(P)-dependent dehydrogenase (short-subunit alcohol dehydrogenase family)
MRSLSDRTVVVAGATGNVGPFVTRALLQRGARVAVPSRSEERLRALREHLAPHLGTADQARLHTFVGDVSDEGEAALLRTRITDHAGSPEAVVASLGDFVTTPSLHGAGRGQLQRALESSVVAHFMVARTFVPAIRDSGGTYVLLQGPLAFELRPEFGANLVSVATAGQHMLFRALAQELDGSPARLVELVVYSLLRDRRTQPGSQVPGEAVGAFAAHLLTTSSDVHGQSIHLRSIEQLTEAGLDIEGCEDKLAKESGHEHHRDR